jgi:hypothetical protein
MRKSDIDLVLKAEFKARSWCLERVARLPPAFVQPTTVTAFFQPRVLRRSEALYLIDGYIGVLNREFENHWLQNRPNTPKRNQHCLVLNIANVDVLRANHWIDAIGWETSLAKFLQIALAQLEQLPTDEESLRLALERDVLMGLPLEKFVLPGSEEKISGLKAFVEGGGALH